jgi:hypothetical protein
MKEKRKSLIAERKKLEQSFSFAGICFGIFKRKR